MSSRAEFAAIDLGAESGRVFSGSFDGERIALREIHRFANEPVWAAGNLYWDILRIFHEIKKGLAGATRQPENPESVGVDTWAVDFGLLGRDGLLLSNPLHHRGPHTEGMIERGLERVPEEEIYRRTGIQFIRINTLYQLLALEGSPMLGTADRLLLVPDLINYWLTGEMVGEFTNATTTQLYDPTADGWSQELVERMSLPAGILPEIVPPAKDLGPLLPEVVEEIGGELSVTTVASHDTASAVVAVPAKNENFAYISSGTWSLVGLETPRPVITHEALVANFTNEGGFGGKTRFLKNVMGLWLLQECRREWAKEGLDYSYEELCSMAAREPGSGALLEPDHPSFLAPGDMVSRIRHFCEATGQSPPEGPAQVTRCVLESLALKYALVVDQAVRIAGRRVEAIHMVGGGCQNELLCRLTAEATGLPVLAGPAEATALGNVMVQAYARGRVGSLEEIREVVRQSIETSTYEPGTARSALSRSQERFQLITDQSAVLEQKVRS